MRKTNENERTSGEFIQKQTLSTYFSNIRRTGFDQSSPVHPVTESRGGTLSVTHGGRTEILVSNIGLLTLGHMCTGTNYNFNVDAMGKIS
jgi:hypothetical protein